MLGDTISLQRAAEGLPRPPSPYRAPAVATSEDSLSFLHLSTFSPFGLAPFYFFPSTSQVFSSPSVLRFRVRAGEQFCPSPQPSPVPRGALLRGRGPTGSARAGAGTAAGARSSSPAPCSPAARSRQRDPFRDPGTLTGSKAKEKSIPGGNERRGHVTSRQ